MSDRMTAMIQASGTHRVLQRVSAPASACSMIALLPFEVGIRSVLEDDGGEEPECCYPLLSGKNRASRRSSQAWLASVSSHEAMHSFWALTISSMTLLGSTWKDSRRKGLLFPEGGCGRPAAPSSS